MLTIYQILVDDFSAEDDPIAPAGVRDRGLLESAIARQWTSMGSVLKYPHPILNAASLTYGICNDHPFLNGNKRTALVAMLSHLDRNGYCLRGVSQGDLYNFMLSIADHKVADKPDPRKKDRRQPRPTADEEVQAIYQFLRRHAARIDSTERVITYRQLRRVLNRFGISLENSGANQAELVRYEEQQKGFLIKKRVTKRIVLRKIGYRDEGTEVSRKELVAIRRACSLTEEDGVDSAAFYNFEATIDQFVNRYRRVLRNLAKV